MRIIKIPPINAMGNAEYSLPEKHKGRERANIVAGSLLGLSALAVLGMVSVLISEKNALKKLPDALFDRKIFIKDFKAFYKNKPYSGTIEYLSEKGVAMSRTYCEGYLIKCTKFNNSFDKTKDCVELSIIRGSEGEILCRILKKISKDGKINILTK